MHTQVVADKDSAEAKSAAGMLYEAALLESGFDSDDPKVRQDDEMGV